MARSSSYRWLKRVVAAVAVASLAAVALRVGDSRSEELSPRDPTAWLVARASGELVQVNAVSGEVMGRVAAGSAGDDLAVVQMGRSALLVDRTKGDAAVIDGRTQRISERSPLPNIDAGSRPYVAGPLAWIVTATMAQHVDPETGTFGERTALSKPVRDGALLADGWFYGVTDRGVAIVGTEVVEPATPLPGPVGAADGHAYAVDGQGAAVYQLNLEAGARRKLCLGVSMAEPLASTTSDADELAVVDVATGTVAVVDVAGNTCRTVEIGQAKGTSTPPLVVDGRVYVALANGGLGVLRASDGEVLGQYRVLPDARPFELFDKDGIVWVNDPDGAAYVAGDTGVVRQFDKSGGSGLGSALGGSVRTGDTPGSGDGSAATGGGVGPGSGGTTVVAGSSGSGSGAGGDAGTGDAGGIGLNPPSNNGSNLIADFDFTLSVVNVDQIVTFTDRSTGGPTAWTWDFGDGSFGSGPKVSHSWEDAGNYVVTLRVDNATQTSKATATIRVLAPNVKERPKADFTFTSQRVEVGTSVIFTSQSKGNPTELKWNFGDSTTQTGSPVTKSWSTAGTFTVTLTASNSEGSDSSSTQITVFDKVEAPTAVIVAESRETVVGQSVSFLSQSLGNPTELKWTFGDGSQPASGSTVRHAWNGVGTFTVTLTASNSAGSNATTVTVNVKEPIVAPVARITASALTVPEDVVVRFTSLSINKPDTLAWDFGDGAAGQGVNVSHSWPKAGIYTVRLTAANAAGDNSTSVNITVTPNLPAPIAAFDVAPAVGEVAVPLTFLDRSVGATEWRWDFGDGTTSNLQNPLKAFAKSGTYPVKLTASNRAGNTTITKSIVVRLSLPVAQFTYAPLTPLIGQVVQFTDASTGGLASTFAWDFGDGTTSVARNPTHAFAAAQSYVVKLVVTNETGQSTATQTVAVSPPAPIANFSFTPVAPQAGQEISFTDSSTGGLATGFVWDFGDGTGSIVANPKKTYLTAGTYPVRLTVSNVTGTNSILKNVVVAVAAPKPAIVAPLAATVNTPVLFDGVNTGGAPTTVLWDFGDGTTAATLDPPAHVYTVARAAPYVVTLTLTNASGTVTATHSIVISVAPSITQLVVAAPTPPYYTGQLMTFTAVATGGTSPYAQYLWTFAGGTPATATTAIASTGTRFAAAGPHIVTVQVRDASGALSLPLSITVNIVAAPPPPTVTIDANGAAAAEVGPRSVTLTATTVGGAAPVTVTWTLPAGAVLTAGTVNSPTITVTLPASLTLTNYLFSVVAADSLVPPQVSPTPATITLTVLPTPPVTTAVVPIEGLALGLSAIAAWRRRRSRRRAAAGS